MGRNRKTYSESLKKQVAIEAMDGKNTVAEIAASNNIAPGMVSAWKKAFINEEFSKDIKKAQKENEELKKQLDAATIALGKAQLMIELIKKSESQGLNLYELIDEDSAKKNLIGFWGLSISEQCKLLKISRSGYYGWKKRKSQESLHDSEADNEKKEREMKLVKDVMDAFMEHPSFGYRKMAKHLKGGINTDATEKKVRLIYQRLGLKGASPKFNTSKPAKTRYVKFPYLLRNKKVDYVNQVWATDITYIKLPIELLII